MYMHTNTIYIHTTPKTHTQTCTYTQTFTYTNTNIAHILHTHTYCIFSFLHSCKLYISTGNQIEKERLNKAIYH